MIFNFLLNIFVGILSIIFQGLPKITTLPTVVGFDLDSALVQGVGYLNTIFTVYWYLKDMFYGALVIFIYYGVKMVLKAVLGSRTPGLH